MLVILPLLAFLLVFLDLLGLLSRRGAALSGRAALLEAAAFLGAYLMIFSEGLSLFKQLAQAGVAVCWGLAIAIAAGIGLWKGLFNKAWQVLREKKRLLKRADLLLSGSLLLILGLLLIIALISPTNNNDSLRFQMSRVMHWAQDRSFTPYATAYIPQLSEPIWAETAVLDVRLLWVNDQLDNLVPWACLLGTLIGVSALAKRLGARRNGQWIAIAFAVSLPMVILQSTNPQTNMEAAFWLVSLLYFIVLSAQRELYLDEFISVALILGLGLATKATFYPYCVPPLFFFIIHQFLRYKPSRVVAHGLVIGGIVLFLNLGYWGRNLMTFGGPLGPAEFVNSSTFSTLTPGGVIGKLVGNIVLNLDAPKDSYNTRIVNLLQKILLPIDPQIVNYKLVAGWNYEDLAGNPLHLFLIPVTLILLLLNRKRVSIRMALAYCLMTLVMYLMLAIVVNSGYTDGRYQLPFFTAWAPLFGLAIEALDHERISTSTTILLFLAALPWVLFNRTRPLIAMRPAKAPFTIPCLADCTAQSILNVPPERIMFAGLIALQAPYAQATDAIRTSSCRSVGLELDSHDVEYPFWWLLDAPQSGIHLETIYPAQEVTGLLDPHFKPCAVLCTICQGETHVHGLGLVSDYSGRVQLYMGPNYSPDPNQ